MASEARKFAVRAHVGQFYGNYPFVYHLDAVASMVAPHGVVVTAAAFLHDVLEDTAVTPSVLLRNGFPEDVVRIVEIVTDPKMPTRAERKAQVNARLLNCAVTRPPAELAGRTVEHLAVILKVADRLANVRESVATALAGNPKSLNRYRREWGEFHSAVHFAPGVGGMLIELQGIFGNASHQQSGL